MPKLLAGMRPSQMTHYFMYFVVAVIFVFAGAVLTSDVVVWHTTVANCGCFAMLHCVCDLRLLAVKAIVDAPKSTPPQVLKYEVILLLTPSLALSFPCHTATEHPSTPATARN